MSRKVKETLEFDGVTLEIGPPMSKDGGLVLVARHIRKAAWFQALVDELGRDLEASPHRAYGFKSRPKLEAGLLALLAGLVLGHRTPNVLAQCFSADPLWTAVVGRPYIQRELSRLMEILADHGESPLRRALLGSALSGLGCLELDMDSSVLELHGKQEWGSYNAHYQTFGYHAGWAIDIRTGKLAALWLNEGKANTATGQPEQLEWILDQGVPVNLARFDAGLINPDMLQALEGRVAHFVCRIRANSALDRLADPLEPPGPFHAGARSYAEISYSAGSWKRPERVVVRFQAPEGAEGEMALFPERFYFVSNLDLEPAEVVATYLRRGEAERIFGEFKATLQPNFRHQEIRKNIVWALLLALAHNVLCDLRDKLPLPVKPAKQRVEHRPQFLPEHWVFGFHRLLDGTTQAVRPLLARVRDLALRVPGELIRHRGRLRLYVRPDILEPAWFPSMVRI